MSLMTETRAVLSLDQLPRVNLLPPEIAESRRFRQVQLGLGAAVAASVLVVAALYVSAASSVGTAQADLDQASAEQSSIQAESAKYSDVTATYARSAAAQAMLTQAMGEEIRFSTLMNDLSLTVPENVWMKSVTFSQAAPAVTGGAVDPAAVPGVGTVAFTGVGFNHDDVAVWLESLAGQKGYANPYFSASTESLLGTRKIVTFTSTATLTPAAYSGNYTKPAGG